MVYRCRSRNAVPKLNRGMAMGLLDDLKKQADLVKTQQILQQNLQGDKLKLVEDKMKQTFQYIHELLKQLGVVKPISPLVYSIPGVADFRNLLFTESFIDYRSEEHTLNSSHRCISYAVFCLKKKKKT